MAFRILQGLAVNHFRISPEIRARFDDESVCRRCGLCCHSGVTLKGRLILLKDLPCKYLFYETQSFASCRVYSRREELGWCNKMNAWNVAKGLFPDDCPYVRDIKGYSGKKIVSEEELVKLLPDLRKVFRNYPRPEYISTLTWNRFLYEVLELPRP